jgi:hypothetical protein
MANAPLLFPIEADEFETFWKAYPRRTAKGPARVAFMKARKTASLAQLLAGIERYKVMKPTYADWAHPATWLNQERWLDEEDATPHLSERTQNVLRGLQ